MEEIFGFFSANATSILNGVARGLLLFSMAVGLSLVFGLMNVLNLAHGAIFLLGAYIGLSLAPSGGGAGLFVLALLVAVVVGASLGAGLGVAVWPVRERGHLDQGLLTLGIAFILSDGIAIFWGSDNRSLAAPSLLRDSVGIFGTPYPVYRLFVIAIGLLIAGGVYYSFEKTDLGAVVRATVLDRSMVSAMGINVDRLVIAVFAAGSALAAFGGVIGAPILGVRPGLDWDVLILALIVVVIGGLGSIGGAFLGALLIGQVQSLGVALVPDIAAFLLFGAMAGILLVRPQGLFGDRTVT